MPWFPFIVGTLALGWGVLLMVYRQRLIAMDNATRSGLQDGLGKKLVSVPRLNLWVLSVGFLVIGVVLIGLGIAYTVIRGWS